MQPLLRTTLYSRIIVKYNVWSYDVMMETQDFFKFLEFLSLDMLTTK